MEDIIQIKKEIDCDLSLVFKFFTQNDLLEQWLTVKAEVNPEVGGKFELFWDPDDKENNSTIDCKITGIENERYISFEWKGPVQFKHFMNSADPLTHVIVFFSSVKPNRTTIHLFHTGWRQNSEWHDARDYFEKAWSNALIGLQERLVRNATL
ncbi:MAG: SRPBCC family protein [Promethearchaeota archaeon]|jgi:uncharacterized protein YndB with AHSA1/START domain